MAEIVLRMTTDAAGAIKGIKQIEAGLEDVDKKAKKGQSTFDEYGKKLAAAFGAAAILKAMDSALKAQGEQEAAINKLNLALANQGKYTDALSASLQNYASGIQDTTTYSQGAALSVMGLFASFGLGEAAIKRSTKAATDFAAATGKSLDEAAAAIGRASTGNVAALQKMGLHFDETATKGQKFESALTQIEQRFGGSASAATATYSGQLAQIKNAYDDVTQSQGKFLGELLNVGGTTKSTLGLLKGLSDFFSKDLILALNESRVKLIEFFAFVAETYAAWARKVSEQGSWVFGFGAREAKRQAAASASAAEEFAKGLRLSIPALREQGNAAAFSAGNLLKVTNATRGATVDTDELKAALSRHLIIMKAVEAGAEAYRQELFDLENQISKISSTEDQLFKARMLNAKVAKGGQTLGDKGFWATPAVMNEIAINEGAIVKHTDKWKAGLVQVAQLATQIASLFADVSGKAAAVGAALGSALGASIGTAFGGPAGAALGGALGGVLGGLVGSLFGGAERERKKREEAQKEAIAQLKSLSAEWEQFRGQIIDRGMTGLGDIFTYMASQTNLSAEQLQRLGVIGMAAFDGLRKTGMSVVDALRAMGPALSTFAGRSTEDLKKLQDQYDALTRTIDLKKKHGNDTFSEELTRWQIGKEIEKGQGAPAGPFKDLSAFAGLVEANEELVRYAEGLGKVMDALRATGGLTVETFGAIQGEAVAAFDSLIGKGFTANQALAILAPTLFGIQQAAEKQGFAVDEATQALIDQADKAGLFEDLQDPMDVLNDLMTDLNITLALMAKAFGVDLPPEVQKYLDKLAGIPKNINTTVNTHYTETRGGGKFGWNDDGTPDNDGDPTNSVRFGGQFVVRGPAGGYRAPFTMHGTETVKVTPGAAGGGDLALLREMRGIRAELKQLPNLIRDAQQQMP